MLVTEDNDLARQARHLLHRQNNDNFEYNQDSAGFDYRFTNLQAALGLAQIERIEQMIERRHQIFQKYENALSDLPGLIGPAPIDGGQPNYWLYLALVDPLGFGMTSRELMAKLRQQKIGSSPIFPPVCENAYLGYTDGPEQFPAAYRIWAQGICLPTGSGLTDQQIDQVIHAVRQAGST